MLEAEIRVMLKKTVLDPQGQVVKHALESLNHKDIEDLRVGRLVYVKLNTDDREGAKQNLEKMCKQLLANPIIEDYKIYLNPST